MSVAHGELRLPSKLVAGVNKLSRPHNVPPPKLVPLTRSNAPSSSTLMIETPDPMFTSKQGSCGVGFLSNVTPNFGGSGLGLSRGTEEGELDGTFNNLEELQDAADDDAAGCETDCMSSSEKKYTSSGIIVMNFNRI